MMSNKTNISMKKFSASMFFALSLMGLAGDVNAMMLDLTPDSQSSTALTVRTVGICTSIPNGVDTSPTGGNIVDPKGEARAYVRNYEKKNIADTVPATVTILQQPAHGILRQITQADIGTVLPGSSGTVDPANPGYIYLPEKGYIGQDKAVVLVEIGGVKVKEIFYFHDMDEPTRPCGGSDGDYSTWKISSTLDTNGTSAITSVEYQTPAIRAAEATNTNVAALASWINTTDLNSNTTGITLNLVNLPNAAVGQTTGTAITLDSNAAGYGWYIDPNPAANTDFLPTSNPNVWMAKVGSAAAGKMDMLSVLLHEYGHALGLDHSANPNDFMSPNLQPGERRLPSAAELTLMSQLAAQLNNVSANATGTATLKNSTGTNAQLAQAFNITSQDRYLEFTVSNGLQN